MIFGIFTSTRHAVKLINFLNYCRPDIEYIVSTSHFGPQELNYDVGICYGFKWLIDEETLKHHDFYNFHPAPLPSHGDVGNYARGLHDLRIGKLKDWGVSLHVIDRGVDSGPVLRVFNIPLMSIPVEAQELGDIGHYYLFQLFKQTISALEKKPKTKEELDKLC